MNAPCKLCEKKRARRHCPGLGGDICPSCCGTERENTIDCPSDLRISAGSAFARASRAARRGCSAQPRHSRRARISSASMRLWWCGSRRRCPRRWKRKRPWTRTRGRRLDALIRTYRTLASGLIYETRPDNPYAARLQDALKNAVEELRKASPTEASGMHIAAGRRYPGRSGVSGTHPVSIFQRPAPRARILRFSELEFSGRSGGSSDCHGESMSDGLHRLRARIQRGIGQRSRTLGRGRAGARRGL